MPAHVVAGALGIEDPMEAKQALIDAFQNDDTEAIKADLGVLEHRLRLHRLPDDPGLYLSPGPYNLTDYTRTHDDVRGQPGLHVGSPAEGADDRLPIIGDPMAAVQAMENEEIDIIQPQATADLLTQLEASPIAGSRSIRRRRDLRARRPGVQQRRAVRPGGLRRRRGDGLAVRQAFLKTIPRQEIVDRLIVPLNPERAGPQLVHPGAGFADYDGCRQERLRGVRRAATSRAPGAARGGRRRPTPIDVRLLFADEQPAASTSTS